MIAERHTLFFSFLVIAWFPGFVSHRDGTKMKLGVTVGLVVHPTVHLYVYQDAGMGQNALY